MKQKLYSDMSADVFAVLSTDEWKGRQTIADEVGVCTRAISEAVQTLREEGIPVVSHQYKGYRLAKSPEEMEISIAWLENKVETFKETIELLKKVQKGAF